MRFMECGSCTEVIRRVGAVRALADESGSEIKVGGVVDRDFQSQTKIATLMKEHDILVLPVHEVENFFLHPDTVMKLAEQHGRTDVDIERLIREVADKRAGSWIFQRAMARDRAGKLPPISDIAKQGAKSGHWHQSEDKREALLHDIVNATGYSDSDRGVFKKLLGITCRAYERQREMKTLWKVCEGKQMLNKVAGSIGFAGSEAMISAAFSLWSREPSLIPEELASFREYLDTL